MKKLLLVLAISSVCFAEEPLKPTKVSTPPVIDGVLEGWEWNNVLSVSSFSTFIPDFGRTPAEKTVAYAAYDSENLYFAFRCYDKNPDKIKNSMSSRDNIRNDDWVCINLDSFADQQSLYAFYVNPNGIQMDSRYAAGQEDFSADFVWYSAGKILPDGYSIEIDIPLKSIRYSNNNPVMMTIFFERYISRFLEHSSYPALDPAKGYAFLSQMKQMEYYDLKNYTLFELLPAFTYSQKYGESKNDLVRNENKGEISITTKYGFNSDLILDATYNPDFSQVESDAGQVDVNLRSALFYSEKRPFFLEGAEIFNVAGVYTSPVDPLYTLVHTRTIVNPITGIKLTGKLGQKNTLAVLYAMDELPSDIAATEGRYAYFPIMRYKRSFSDDSYIGGIFTDREVKNAFNRVIGIDGIFRLSPSSTFEWNGIFSNSKLSNTDPVKDGSIASLGYKYSSRNVEYNFWMKNISENFNVETGYLARNGLLTFSGLYGPKFYPSKSFIQRIDVEAFTAQTRDKPSSLWETYNHLSGQFYFFDNLTAKIRYFYSTEIFDAQRFNTGGLSLQFGGQITKKFLYSIAYSKVQAIYYSSAPYQGKSDRVNFVAVYKPTENIESNTTIVFSNFYRSSDNQLIYEYPIFREKLTYQFNKYLFFRGIVQYNKFRRELLTDFLISFTYVPGTVVFLGYGSLYERTTWDENQFMYVNDNGFRESQRGFFFKMSYLWRL